MGMAGTSPAMTTGGNTWRRVRVPRVAKTSECAVPLVFWGMFATSEPDTRVDKPGHDVIEPSYPRKWLGGCGLRAGLVSYLASRIIKPPPTRGPSSDSRASALALA